MSTAEIINELPKLSEAERRSIRDKLLELTIQNPDVSLCDQTASEGAALLDRMEAEDARRERR